MTALRSDLDSYVGHGIESDAFEMLADWIENDDDGLAVAFCDQLTALFQRTDLSREQTRARLVDLFKHLAHALDQGIW
jgi:hypothetical protein